MLRIKKARYFLKKLLFYLNNSKFIESKANISKNSFEQSKKFCFPIRGGREVFCKCN